MKRFLGMLTAAVLAFATGLVLFHFGMLAFARSGAEKQIPDLVGTQLTVARTLLEEAGFAGVVDREAHSSEFGEGSVVQQRPKAGAVLRHGRKVWLTVSLGVRKTAAPQLQGMTARQAGIELGREGLTTGAVARIPHPTVARGEVIAQDPPPGAPCAERARVNLLVSLGRAPAAWVLPRLTGRPLSDVSDLLERNGLRVGEETVLLDRSVLPSTVLEQEPRAGSRVAAGDEVDLVVSSKS